MSDIKSLTDRLAFLSFTPQLQERLRGMKFVLMGALPGALDSFYVKLQAFPETVRFFPNEEMIRHAKGKQHGHWDTITNGRLSENYLSAATRIGQIHAKIGLEPRWYIAGYSAVLEALLAALVKARWPKGRFGSKAKGHDELAEEIGVLIKATLLDMELAISVYLEASESGRNAAEAQNRSSAEAVGKAMTEAMAALAAGDLTHRIGDKLPADYAKLRLDFNTAMEKLAGTLAAIQSSSRIIHGSIEELSQASDDMARRT